MAERASPTSDQANPNAWAPGTRPEGTTLASSALQGLTVLVSGCHSGPSPSAGLGVARSLRLAYADAYLIAKDHSVHASGLHDTVFDDTWVCRPWNEVDLRRHREEIQERLRADAWLLSVQDLEIRWLAEAPDLRALVPLSDALGATAKPGISAAAALPVKVPEWIGLSAPERDVYAFGRAHGWRVWVKGSAYEAKAVQSWPELTRVSHLLGETWGEAALFVQADVRGWEVSIAFSAVDGQLLDAVFMEKRLVTETGKTWAGEISDVPSPLLGPLREIVRELRWTGGGELEFVRDPDGVLWLIDWNPRFPAWVFGATLAGRNLPAQLLAAASGLPGRQTPRVASQFTRIVTEVPVRNGFSLPPPPLEKPDPEKGGKNPSGMPLLMRRLGGARPAERQAAPGELPLSLLQDLQEMGREDAPTPYRGLLRQTALDRFKRVASLVESWADGRTPMRVAYSVKTNPEWGLLRLARDCGFLAEVISSGELQWALEAGFRPDQVVYNGPIPLSWEEGQPGEVRAAFADSTSALRGYGESSAAGVVGLRVRPPLAESRFGIRLEDPVEFREVVDVLRDLPAEKAVGLSLHLASSEVGPDRWESLARGALYFGAAIQQLAGKEIQLLDLGGGWAADDLELALQGILPSLMERAQSLLPGLREAIIEPGKALVEPCGAVICRVVEVRQRGDGTSEAVVDASIAEVPLIHSFPHRLVAVSDDRVELLGAGPDRVLGRLCMENDIVGKSVALPPWLLAGHRLCICDSGAYDASMAYRFGLGGSIIPEQTGDGRWKILTGRLSPT